MNSEQRSLIEKTLGGFGWLGVVVTCAILAYALFYLSTTATYKTSQLVRDLFSLEDAALIVWPPLAIGLVLLWIRAFIRAGGSGER